MSTRVIAGTAKGRRLKLVPGDGTRPIMDRVKEALFNIIGRDIYDAHFLDMFAGTGSVGIEALSRGAERAVFWESERVAVETIRQNLDTTGFTNRAEIIRGDAFRLLERTNPPRYDYLFVAPPQYKGMWQKTLLALEANPVWLPADTQVIVQIDPKERTPITLNHLEMVDERRYGNTLLWFFNAKSLEPDTEG